jgi:hypothetical protein
MGYWNTDPAQPRDVGAETRDTLQAQVDLAPKQLAAAQATQPGYDALSLQSLNSQMYGTGGQTGYLDLYQTLAPQFADMQNQSLTSQRQAEINDISTLGPQATQAMLASNPYQKTLLDRINAMTAGDMQDPYSLTATQQRLAQQASRAAMASRGMNGTNLGAANEVFNNYLASNAEAQRRLGNANQTVSMNQAVVGDPWQQILGRASGANAAALAGAGQAGNAGQAVTSGVTSMFDPFNSYASQLFGQNYAGDQAYKASQQTGANKAKFISDTTGSFIGSVAKGVMCWVAREVYGEDDKRWLEFRWWLLTVAPKWFHDLYARRGEAFAAWLHNNPWLKPSIRRWMDGRIATMRKNHYGRA